MNKLIKILLILVLIFVISIIGFFSYLIWHNSNLCNEEFKIVPSHIQIVNEGFKYNSVSGKCVHTYNARFYDIFECVEVCENVDEVPNFILMDKRTFNRSTMQNKAENWVEVFTYVKNNKKSTLNFSIMIKFINISNDKVSLDDFNLSNYYFYFNKKDNNMVSISSSLEPDKSNSFGGRLRGFNLEITDDILNGVYVFNISVWDNDLNEVYATDKFVLNLTS